MAADYMERKQISFVFKTGIYREHLVLIGKLFKSIFSDMIQDSDFSIYIKIVLISNKLYCLLNLKTHLTDTVYIYKMLTGGLRTQTTSLCQVCYEEE